jgi:uncharacterized membrane protein
VVEFVLLGIVLVVALIVLAIRPQAHDPVPQARMVD